MTGPKAWRHLPLLSRPLSRWCGTLEITSEAFLDDSPIFSDPDPFVVRFHVKPIVALDPEKSLPIFEDPIWNYLGETKDTEKRARGWAIAFRGSLRHMSDDDGTLLVSLLRKQADVQVTHPLTERDLAAAWPQANREDPQR